MALLFTTHSFLFAFQHFKMTFYTRYLRSMSNRVFFFFILGISEQILESKILPEKKKMQTLSKKERENRLDIDIKYSTQKIHLKIIEIQTRNF